MSVARLLSQVLSDTKVEAVALGGDFRVHSTSCVCEDFSCTAPSTTYKQMTYMHSTVASLLRLGTGALFSLSDARSNECCDTVIILGNGAASPVCL